MRTTKDLLALVESAPDWDPQVDIHLHYRGAGDGCEAVWRAEVETAEPVGVGRWEDPEIDAIGGAFAALLGALDRPTLRHLIAAADALSSLALAAGLPADAPPAEVVARVGEWRSVLHLIDTWRHTYGADLKPTAGSADTFGDGMRKAKAEIGGILASEAGR